MAETERASALPSPARFEVDSQTIEAVAGDVVVAPPGAGVTVPLPVDDLVNDDLTIATSFGYSARAWERVVGLLNAGAIEPSRIVTHRFPLDDHAAAFEALRGGAEDGAPRGKVVLELAG
jgi:threonine dehydrogenase-like Zn-dependent dehydrogenase